MYSALVARVQDEAAISIDSNGIFSPYSRPTDLPHNTFAIQLNVILVITCDLYLPTYLTTYPLITWQHRFCSPYSPYYNAKTKLRKIAKRNMVFSYVWNRSTEAQFITVRIYYIFLVRGLIFHRLPIQLPPRENFCESTLRPNWMTFSSYAPIDTWVQPQSYVHMITFVQFSLSGVRQTGYRCQQIKPTTFSMFVLFPRPFVARPIGRHAKYRAPKQCFSL